MGKLQRKHKNSGKRGKRRGIKIIQYNLDGSQVQVWTASLSFISIKKQLGLIHKRVVKACKNRAILNGAIAGIEDISILFL